MLLSAITFAPAISHGVTATPAEGFLSTRAAKTTCAPGDICASTTIKRNGCFVNNWWDGTNGGTPLAIDVTQTGPQGSPTYVYWVNNTNKNIVIKGNVVGKYYCL